MIVIYTAIITPFDVQGEIDYSFLGDLITWQADAKIDGLVVCGTNGEFSSLGFEEVKALLQFVIDRRKASLEIIAGTGRPSLKETIALCKAVEGLAEKALVVPPYYFKGADPAGIYDYFKRLLEETNIPIIFYNIPKYTGIEVTPNLLNRLKKHGALVGIKDSSGQIESIEKFVNECPDLSIYVGSDALLYPSFDKGAVGAITSISNFLPKAMLEVRNQFEAGDRSAAKEAQERILQIRSILKQFPNRAAIKYAISLQGYPVSYVRPPLVNLSEQEEQELKIKLQNYLENQ